MKKQELQIEALARQRLAGEDVQVLSVQVRLTGATTRVQATLDTRDGITIEQCARYNRWLRELLEPVFPDISVEVLSPGLDRVLKTERDFQRVLGKRVKVTRLVSGGKSTELHGIVDRVEAGRVCFSLPDGRVVAMPLDDIITAKQEIRWSHGK